MHQQTLPCGAVQISASGRALAAATPSVNGSHQSSNVARSTSTATALSKRSARWPALLPRQTDSPGETAGPRMKRTPSSLLLDGPDHRRHENAGQLEDLEVAASEVDVRVRW